MMISLFLARLLELDHHRRSDPRPPLAGSTHIYDRDMDRLRADLRYAADRQAQLIDAQGSR